MTEVRRHGTRERQGRGAWLSLIDYLKALAICLVITNHSLPTGAREEWPFFFIVRMAVPIFVLISGYNFAMGMRRAGSVTSWYSPKRLMRKMRTYLFPMLAVYLLWVMKGLAHPRFDFTGAVKALILQSYGPGAYYFWIIVQLYLMFPLAYWLIRKYKGGGGILLIFNLLYEVILYFLPIPTCLYRIIALRYTLLLALGCRVCGKLNEGRGGGACPLFQAACFIAGCAYIAFFSCNRENTDIFRYTTWGNTNVFSCLYIVPLFYAALAMFRDYRIRPGWLHRLVSAIGQSSYYILCTQMVMFWFVGRIWNRLDAPLAVSVACNIFMAVASGIFVNWLVNRMKKVPG